MKKELFGDGHHYDAQNQDWVADISFFRNQLQPSHDPILEMACGTGRVTIPLAQDGFTMVGLDSSPAMLERGRMKAVEKDVDITWILGDCRDFQLSRRFQTILFPFNSIALLLTRRHLEDCLDRVYHHLSSNGRFILCLFNPSLAILSRDPTIFYPLPSYWDPAGGGRVMVKERNFYDRSTQINHITRFFQRGDEEWEEELQMRIYYPEEMEALLFYNGFTVLERFGDYDASSFTSSSPQQLWVCTPGGGP